MKTGELSRRLKITKRQLKYWAERNIIVPARSGAADGPFLYTPSNSYLCSLAVELHAMGFPGSRLRLVVSRVASYVQRRNVFPEIMAITKNGNVHILPIVDTVRSIRALNRSERGGVWVLMSEQIVAPLL